jgi:hypothetical protein
MGLIPALTSPSNPQAAAIKLQPSPWVSHAKSSALPLFILERFEVGSLAPGEIPNLADLGIEEALWRLGDR